MVPRRAPAAGRDALRGCLTRNTPPWSGWTFSNCTVVAKLTSTFVETVDRQAGRHRATQQRLHILQRAIDRRGPAVDGLSLLPAETARLLQHCCKKNRPFDCSCGKPFATLAVIVRWRAGCGLIGRPVASEFALAGYSLVRFGRALDPVLKFAASLRQLHGYHVAGTCRSPTRETCGERDSLTGSELVLRHLATFPAHACDSGAPRGLCPPQIESLNPEKLP